MSAYNYDNYKETEAGYPTKCSGDGFGEYRYIKTYCGNMWFSIDPNPMRRDIGEERRIEVCNMVVVMKKVS